MMCDDLFIQSKLPEPLSQKDLTKYFEEYMLGDKHAREIIITHNMKLVLNVIYKKFSNFPDKKELVSTGIIGLIKAVDTFDISKKSKFSSYASVCIYNEMLMYLRKENRGINDDSLERIISEIDDSHLKLRDILADNSINMVTDYEEKEIICTSLKVIEELNERDKEIVKLYYGLCVKERWTQKEIAKKFGISRSYVSKIISNFLVELKQVLINEGYLDFINSSYVIHEFINNAQIGGENEDSIKSIGSKKH